MIEVNPEKRLTLTDINRHPWVTAGGKGELELELPMMDVVQTHVIPSVDAMDPDVLQAISSLGCFKDKDSLIQELLSVNHNTEKVIYFLLLERKRRRPAYEDDTESILRVRSESSDPPRKRIDTLKVNGTNSYQFGQISEGSPLTPRRQQFHGIPRHHRRPTNNDSISPQFSLTNPIHSSFNNTPSTTLAGILSPVSQRASYHHRSVHGSHTNTHTHGNNYLNTTTYTMSNNTSQLVLSPGSPHAKSGSTSPVTPPTPHHQRANSSGAAVPTLTTPESEKLTPNVTLTSNLLPMTPPGSPHPSTAHHWRSRLNTIKNSFLGSPRFHRRKMQTSSEEVHLTPESSPELTKKSWFGNLMTTEKDETFTILVKGKPLASVKADLIHAFLSIAELSHSVSSPMSFRVEYKRGTTGPAMFQRQVRFQVDISTITKQSADCSKEYLYAITFTLLSGNIRRFRRVCEHIQSQVCSRRPPPSPRAARKFTTELSESSSCGSDTSERLSPYPGTRQIDSDVESDTSVFDVKSPSKETTPDKQMNNRRRNSTTNNNNNHDSISNQTTTSNNEMSQSQQLRMTQDKTVAVRSHSESKTDGLESLEKCRVTATSESVA